MNAYIYPGISMIRTPEMIIASVCDHYDVNYVTFLQNTQTRKQPYAEIRQLCILLMIHHLKYSEKKAAKYFNRNHATAHHAKKVIANLYQVNRNFRERNKTILSKIFENEKAKK